MQNISIAQLRLALANWFMTNGIVDATGQTPNVDSFIQSILVKAPSHNNMPVDPADDENVCISCQ